MDTSNVSFAKYCDKLPFLPLMEICRHLGPLDKFACSISSDRVGDVLKTPPENRSSAEMRLTFGKDHDEIMVIFYDDPSKCFVCSFRESPNYGETVHMERQITPTSSPFDIALNSRKYKMTHFNFYAAKFENLEKSFLRMIHLIRDFFTTKYGYVSCDTGPSRLDRSLRLLASLPPGDGGYLWISKCQKSIFFKDLEKFLRNVRFTDYIAIRAPIDTAFTSEKMHLVAESIHIDDARFLTRHHMETMEFGDGVFGLNILKSKDFNVFLRRWKEGRIDGSPERMHFKISDQQTIEMKKVVKGLGAKPWRPTVRDRTKLFAGDTYPPINLEKGLDLVNADRLLGTVLVTKKDLTFVTWSERFPVRAEKQHRLRFINLAKNLILDTQKRKREHEQRLKDFKDSFQLKESVRLCEEEIEKNRNSIKDNKERLMLLDSMN